MILYVIMQVYYELKYGPQQHKVCLIFVFNRTLLTCLNPEHVKRTSWLSTIPKNRKVKPSSLQSCAQVLVLSRHVWFHGSSQSVVFCKLVVYHVGIRVSWKQCVVSFMHNIFDCFLVNLIQFLSRKEKQTYLCFWKFEYNLSKWHSNFSWFGSFLQNHIWDFSLQTL